MEVIPEATNTVHGWHLNHKGKYVVNEGVESLGRIGCNHKISKVPLDVSMLSALSSTKTLYVKQVLMTFHLVCHHPPRKVSHALQLVVDEELWM